MLGYFTIIKASRRKETMVVENWYDQLEIKTNTTTSTTNKHTQQDRHFYKEPHQDNTIYGVCYFEVD